MEKANEVIKKLPEEEKENTGNEIISEKLLKGLNMAIENNKINPSGNGTQRPRHRIVFESGNQNAAARLYQSTNSNIKSMGTIGGKNHLLRRAGEKPSCPLPALQAP